MKNIHFKYVASIGLLIALVGLGIHGCASNSGDKNSTESTTAQTEFASTDDALASLVNAVSTRDKEEMRQLFGPEGADILDSGDEIADRALAAKFLEAYRQKHRLDVDKDGSATLIVGDNEWPMPIPLVKDKDSGKWAFDTSAGLEEIVNRRIGQNELDVIQTCKAICDAQLEYAETNPGDGEYARKFVSDPGKKNGLYWPTQPGETMSPLGEFAAHASGEGYATGATTEPRPYHGYYYRILTAQGASAPGGAMDYVLNGKLMGGFAVVAWPSDYANSGVMTFLTNYKGEVYQKDLGEETDEKARAMTAFDPDPSWKKVD